MYIQRSFLENSSLTFSNVFGKLSGHNYVSYSFELMTIFHSYKRCGSF